MKTAIVTIILIALLFAWPAWLEKRTRGAALVAAALMPVVAFVAGWVLR